jgi:hypothetical protein
MADFCHFFKRDFSDKPSKREVFLKYHLTQNTWAPKDLAPKTTIPCPHIPPRYSS